MGRAALSQPDDEELRRRAERIVEELPAETAGGRIDPASGGPDSVHYSDEEDEPADSEQTEE